jgi:phosphoenolpyruvate carboxykinase (ATP)
MYHFISGYTAKIGGTEEGVKEPTATFSACFGQPFLVWHPNVYAKMLSDLMQKHAADAWLINTGWIGGGYGKGGHRISLRHTRAILDAIHTGTLSQAQDEEWTVFNLRVPCECPGVPADLLHPERAWSDLSSYNQAREKLAALFNKNFEQYAPQTDPKVLAAGPKI